MMNSRVKLSAVGLTAVLAVAPGTAWADQVNLHEEVVCRKGANVALVRFAMAWNGDAPVYRRLPSSVDGGLSAERRSKRHDCTMANGWTIRARSGERQAYAYGMGGGDPPAFFSLWIARHKVLSRKEWKPGYGDGETPWTIAVVIRPDRLTICRVAASSDAPEKGKIKCSDNPLRLDRYEIDHVEYAPPGSKLAVGTRLVMSGSPEPKLCQEFLRIHRKDWPESYAMVDSAKIFGTKLKPAEPPRAEAIIEVETGVRRKLISWSADNHYFDGDLIFLAPATADAKPILKDEMIDDPARFPTEKLPVGWHLISGGQPGLYPDVSWRYVHFDTQKIRGRVYLLAQPTNFENQPAAILVRPTATGHRVVCRFDQVEPNF
ncbi:hypothetical protein [Sphingomonas sp. URHD0057]|uniref:hypothetical protein n=1 Tax=Sphingomonas sp. URHD0057 TaxID=1380389 RepID=UPI00048AA3D0|nr:hypothetical protein [Sphingomonas sp. URHD0057]